MAEEPTIEFDASGLDDKAHKRLLDAAKQAGIKVTTPASGGSGLQVLPGEQGTVETSLSLDTKGLDDDAIDRLRATVYGNDRNTRIIDSVLKGAIGGYGVGNAARDVFVQWVWCEWLQYHGMDSMAQNETFKKRYAIRPPVESLKRRAAGSEEENW